MLELLLSDSLFRQIVIPIAIALLGWFTRQLSRSLEPAAIEKRVSQSVAAPSPSNGNGYSTAILTTNQRVTDMRDDLREDMRLMEGRFMDKINWLATDMEEVIDAQNRRITQLERLIVPPPGSHPVAAPPPITAEDGQALLAKEKRRTDKFPAVKDEPESKPGSSAA